MMMMIVSPQIRYIEVFDIPNPPFNEQIWRVPSDFVKSRFHCILKFDRLVYPSHSRFPSWHWRWSPPARKKIFFSICKGLQVVWCKNALEDGRNTNLFFGFDRFFSANVSCPNEGLLIAFRAFVSSHDGLRLTIFMSRRLSWRYRLRSICRRLSWIYGLRSTLVEGRLHSSHQKGGAGLDFGDLRSSERSELERKTLFLLYKMSVAQLALTRE